MAASDKNKNLFLPAIFFTILEMLYNLPSPFWIEPTHFWNVSYITVF